MGRDTRKNKAFTYLASEVQGSALEVGESLEEERDECLDVFGGSVAGKLRSVGVRQSVTSDGAG